MFEDVSIFNFECINSSFPIFAIYIIVHENNSQDCGQTENALPQTLRFPIFIHFVPSHTTWYKTFSCQFKLSRPSVPKVSVLKRHLVRADSKEVADHSSSLYTSEHSGYNVLPYWFAATPTALRWTQGLPRYWQYCSLLCCRSLPAWVYQVTTWNRIQYRWVPAWSILISSNAVSERTYEYQINTVKPKNDIFVCRDVYPGYCYMKAYVCEMGTDSAVWKKKRYVVIIDLQPKGSTITIVYTHYAVTRNCTRRVWL